jgi:sulfonate transport system substrate-binding protein
MKTFDSRRTLGSRALKIGRRLFLAGGAGLLLGLAAPSVQAADKATSIGLDWATYNPLSIAIKNKGWMEQEFAKDNIQIRWTQSAGSNISLGLLNSGQVDFGSTAGGAAMLGKIAGGAIKSVYAFSRPEWTALLVKQDSAIAGLADLKGKRIAVARGTDPHIFLMRALQTAGMTDKDVKILLMQHDNGRQALEAGDVDAWMGLDPLMAQSELKGGTKLLYRNPEYNTWGILNVREEFAAANPELVKRVLRVYDKARKWALENPAELKGLMAQATQLPDDVVARALSRTDFSQGTVGATQQATLVAAGKALQSAGVIAADVDVPKVVTSLIDASYASGL